MSSPSLLSCLHPTPYLDALTGYYHRLAWISPLMSGFRSDWSPLDSSLPSLVRFRVITFEKPEGWITFDISSEVNDDGDGLCPVYAYVLHIVVSQNHMSGKDTHVRGLRVLGPIDDNLGNEDDVFAFRTPAFRRRRTQRNGTVLPSFNNFANLAAFSALPELPLLAAATGFAFALDADAAG
ncbi:hypothetical protein NMY22_g18735 [Coprinellus aureogranulatus]|nr:hypothetical protein NMY22_g18735 [Coprinellus aureogranulatus]